MVSDAPASKSTLNTFTLLSNAQSSLLKSMNLVSSSSTNPTSKATTTTTNGASSTSTTTTTARRRTAAPQSDSETSDQEQGDAGIGYKRNKSDKDKTTGRKEDEALRRTMLGKRKGVVGDWDPKKKKAEESSEDEEGGRGSLGRRKRPKRAMQVEDDEGPAETKIEAGIEGAMQEMEGVQAETPMAADEGTPADTPDQQPSKKKKKRNKNKTKA